MAFRTNLGEHFWTLGKIANVCGSCKPITNIKRSWGTFLSSLPTRPYPKLGLEYVEEFCNNSPMYFVFLATCHNVNNCTDPVHGACKTTDVCQCNHGYVGK